jgi:hypothetical protein
MHQFNTDIRNEICRVQQEANTFPSGSQMMINFPWKPRKVLLSNLNDTVYCYSLPVLI